MNLKRAFLIAAAALLLTPGLAMAGDGPGEGYTVRFAVTKWFADDNPADVTVTLECNTGHQLVQTAEISMFGPPVVFVVNNFIDGDEFWCKITEDGPDGYRSWFKAFNAEPYTLEEFDETDEHRRGHRDYCYYRGADNDETLDDRRRKVKIEEFNVCMIGNAPEWVEVDVTKSWTIPNEGGDEYDELYARVIVKSDEIKDADKCGHRRGGHHFDEHGSRDDCKVLEFVGENPTDKYVKVMPTWDGQSVEFYEVDVDSAVEASNNCGGEITVYPGDTDAGCDFHNVLFFEGIPTLNQYGLAIMALLMLGLGYVGFRRFV